MGLYANRCCCCGPMYLFLVLVAVVYFTTAFAEEDRCKDESFCRAYCLSTNPDTVSARCGRDMASCICITPDNHAVKVRFIEERTPVPPTTSTTPRPAKMYNGVQYVNSQALPNSQYNGNSNSIAGGQNQQQQPPTQNTPVLLKCDASEASTRMCHFFCTMEIRAWYGLCNTTSEACACFGIPLSAVSQEPIAAIFHSTGNNLYTAPVTHAPQTTPKPTYSSSPLHPGHKQFYPPSQYLQHQQHQPLPLQQQQQQWIPITSSPSHQTMYNNNQFYPASSPSSLNAAASQDNPSFEHPPVRSAASLFGSNGQPVIDQPTVHAALKSSAPTAAHLPSDAHDSTNSNIGTLVNEESVDDLESTTIKATRRRRSINDTPVKSSKGKNLVATIKDSSTGEDSCSRYKCAISCKRNNYLAPDCQPKCIDGQCWCECFPRL